MKGILADTEHMLAQGKMDLPLSLCFAAARGDDLLLHQLLRRGSNSNEMDKNGRTALVKQKKKKSSVSIPSHPPFSALTKISYSMSLSVHLSI